MLTNTVGLASRVRRTVAAFSLACVAVSLVPTCAQAYSARLVWHPVRGAAGYMVYVRYGDGNYQAPLFVGSKYPDKDGMVRVFVTDLKIGEEATFGVRAYDSSEAAGGFSNLITVGYPEAASVADSDGDGFTDAQEDSNLNGIVDPWETDPHDGTSSLPDVCSAARVGASCDDGVPCTYSDTCRDGVCRGVGSCPSSQVCSLEARACIRLGTDTLWIAPANDPSAVFNGNMIVDTEYVGGNDQDPDADSIASKLVSVDSSESAWQSGNGSEIEYALTIPESATWFLWGRFYYPGSGTDAPNSFFARIDQRPSLEFGNNRDFLRRWHWDGDGTIERGSPVPLLLGHLPSGKHMLHIEQRESGAKAPQLDLLALTKDPLWIPTDAEAVSVLGECGDGSVGLDEECDDGPDNGNTSRSRCRKDCSLPQVCGDANGDGRVSATDSAILQRASVGIGVSCPYWRCDVNQDGLISTTDAFRVLGFSVGRNFQMVCAKI